MSDSLLTLDALLKLLFSYEQSNNKEYGGTEIIFLYTCK